MYHFLKYGLTLLAFLSLEAWSQNILVLEKGSGGHIRWYYAGDHIELKTKKGNRIDGRIREITDSSLIVNVASEVMMSDITTIYRKRHMLDLLQKVTLIGGVLYISLSALNGAINKDSPVVPDETLKISGGLIAAALLLMPFTTRRHEVVGNAWKLKILDLTD